MSEAVKITGLKNTIRDLAKLDEEALIEVRALNIETAEVVARDAAVRAPRVSGLLADSIATSTSKSGFSAYVSVGRGLRYAPPIHWGWPRRNIAPQPFLYEALDSKRAEVIAKYEAGIKALCERFGEGL